MKLTTLLENELTATLIALSLLLLSAFIFGNLLEKIKGPRVVGEILGGMLIGGSGLFLLFPDFMKTIFFAFPEEGKVLNIFYQLGLIFLMFISGYNTEIKLNRENAKTIGRVFIGSTIIPMALAIPFISIFRPHFTGEAGNNISFNLVFMIGVAITSIPVISKIFFDMGIMNTKFANTILTVSTFQDLCLWILLNAATRIATTGEIKLFEMVIVVLSTIGIFVVVAIFNKKAKTIKTQLPLNTFYTLSFIFLMIVCALLYKAGINIMYSSFICGYIIKTIFGTEKIQTERLKYLESFAFSFFVPIYFALVGIQLNVVHDFSLYRFSLFFIIAFGLEFIGTWILLLKTKLNQDMRINFAITMNARGGPGIVLATVAYAAKIINIEFFTVLILTTMLSSMIAGYWLRFQQKKDSEVFNKL